MSTLEEKGIIPLPIPLRINANEPLNNAENTKIAAEKNVRFDSTRNCFVDDDGKPRYDPFGEPY